MRRLVAIALVAVLAGCGSKQPATPGGLTLLKADVGRAAPAADAPVGDLVAGIERFGYDLAPAGTTDNWVASPVSIAVALGMLRAGANGQTATQLDQVLGFPTGVHAAFNALTSQVVTTAIPPTTSDQPREAGAPARPSVVALGDAIFTQQGFPITPDYLTTLAESYGTGVYPVDFHQDSAAQSIDAWAKDMTAGRVDKVFDRIDPDTAAVLVNTIYFKGEWRYAFDPDRTGPAPFHRADGTSADAPTMADTLNVGYAAGPGWQAIELPYGEDGTYAMRVLLPTGDTDPRELLAVEPTFDQQEVEIQLPKWDFSTEVALKAELQRLGVTDAFDPDTADLSGISTTSLYVTQAIHRATITVDEAGTEAAAVTGIALGPTSAVLAPATFHADHPFAFTIVQVATGAPLFEGIVANPASA